jgi:hypothetical protein
VHASIQAVVGLIRERRLEVLGHAVHEPLHARVAKDPRTAQGAQVVDEVERPGRRVEARSEVTGDTPRQQGEDADQDHQVANEQVAEGHVEQQLLVRPSGAVRWVA